MENPVKWIGGICLGLVVLAIVWQPQRLADGTESRANIFSKTLSNIINSNVDIFAVLLFVLIVFGLIKMLGVAGGGKKKGD